MRQEQKIDRTGCQHRQLVEEYPEVIHARGGAENPLHKRPSLLHYATYMSILFLAAFFGTSGAFAEGLEHTGSPALVIKGEQVASGVYFYQIQAGDLVATRRLVIVK